MGGQRIRGIVKTYSENNGYGFVGGDEVQAAVGKDVFLHQREVTEVTGISRPQVPSGAAVSFTITINNKGQPQARDLAFEDQSSMHQMHQLGNAIAPPVGSQAVAGPQYVQGGRRFSGFVRSFSSINGFGFVGGDEVMQHFGKDAFLHYRELTGASPGDTNAAKINIPSGTWVSFTVTLNQKGQPQARDIQFQATGCGYQMGYPQGYGSMAVQSLAGWANLSVMNAGWTNPSLMQQPPGAQPTDGVSEADTYARVQADIAKFQAEVAALRDANDKRERSRSPRREQSPAKEK